MSEIKKNQVTEEARRVGERELEALAEHYSLRELQAWIRDELDEKTSEAIRVHLASCKPCLHWSEEIRQIMEKVDVREAMDKARRWAELDLTEEEIQRGVACGSASDWAQYVEGTISAERKQYLDEHIKKHQCQECREERDFYVHAEAEAAKTLGEKQPASESVPFPGKGKSAIPLSISFWIPAVRAHAAKKGTLGQEQSAGSSRQTRTFNDETGNFELRVLEEGAYEIQFQVLPSILGIQAVLGLTDRNLSLESVKTPEDRLAWQSPRIKKKDLPFCEGKREIRIALQKA